MANHEALLEEAILEEQMLALMHRFADRFTDRRIEINNLMVLQDHPLIDYVNVVSSSFDVPDDPNMPALEDIGIFDDACDDRDEVAEADLNNLELTTVHDMWQITVNAHIYNDGRNPGIPPLAHQLFGDV
ncbi:hypothetical protein Tco_0097883 [Tanacetum coccineum]